MSVNTFEVVDYAVEIKFREQLKKLEPEFGPLDLESALFLIGVQELGQGYKKFKKDEKINLMHIAICTLLEPHGYYSYEGNDADGWPHFQLNTDLPPLAAKEQEQLMKEAIIDYFESIEE